MSVAGTRTRCRSQERPWRPLSAIAWLKLSHHIFMDRNGNSWRVQPVTGKVSRYRVKSEAEFREFRSRVISVHRMMSDVQAQKDLNWLHFERTTAKLTHRGSTF